MPDPNIFELDVSRLPAQIATVNKALKSIGVSLEDVRNITDKYNSITDVTSKVFEGVDRTGQRFNLTLKDTSKLFSETEANITKVNKRLGDTEKQIRAATVSAKSTIKEIRKQEAERIRLVELRARTEVNLQKWINDQTIALIRAGQIRINRIRSNRKTIKANDVIAQIRVQEAERIRLAKLSADTQVRLQRWIGDQTVAVIRNEQLRINRIRSAQKRVVANQVIAQARLQDGVKKTGEETVKAGAAGAKAGKIALISWRSFGRLFVVQALHAGIALVRRTLADAGRDAIEFSRRVAEIRTIIGDANESTQDWSHALEAISQDLPFTQIQVAEAAYQALSNQVIKTTKDLGFVREAGKLALVGVSDIKTAVNALTSVINAYGEGTFRTAKISGVLFESIKLGRTRLSELEQNLGRVTILSAKLGVSFEEQQAALTTLTIQGLKDNVSKTLLINVYNKLIRPSERMKELFKEWGVNTGESAIKTFGLVGVLNKLDTAVKQSGKGLEDVGEIFKRVRATIGRLGLDTKKVEENTKKLTDSYDEFRKKTVEIQETLGVKVSRELVRLNSLAIKLGTTFLELAQPIVTFFGGSANIIRDVIRAVIDVGAALTATFQIGFAIRIVSSLKEITNGLRSLAIGARVAEGAFAGLPGVLAALSAFVIIDLVQAYANWEQHVLDNIENVRKRFQKLNDAITEQSNKSINKWVDSITEGSKKVFKSLRLVNVEITKMQQKLEVDLIQSFSDLKDNVEQFGRTASDALKLDISTLRKTVSDISSKIRETTTEIEQLVKKKADVDKKLSDRAFNQGNIGLSIAAQARRFGARALQPGRDTEGAISDLKEILKLSDQFETKLKAQATRTVSDAIKRSKLNVTSEQRATLVERELANLKKVTGVDLVRSNVNKKITELLTKQSKELEKQRIEKENQNKIDKQREKDAKKALDIKTAKEKALREAIRQFAAFDIKDATERANKAIKTEDAETKVLQVRDALLRQLASKTRAIQQAAFEGGLDPQVSVNIFKEIQGRRVQIYQDAQNQIADIRKRGLVQERKESEDRFNELVKQRATAQEKQVKIVTQSEETIALEIERLRTSELSRRKAAGVRAATGNFDSVTADKTIAAVTKNLELIKQEEQLTNDLALARKRQFPDEKSINDIIKRRKVLLDQIINNVTGIGTSTDRTNKNIGDATIGKSTGRILGALQDEKSSAIILAKAASNIGNFSSVIDQLNLKLEAAGLNRTTVNDPIKENTLSLKDLTDKMSHNIDATAALNNSLILIGKDRGIAGFNRGGTVHGPSGIDKVPAWLTQGEYIINAASARQNLPLLQAINNNRTQRFNRGGEVRNYSFGNINVTGGSTVKQTARQIGRELKREINRGTVSL